MDVLNLPSTCRFPSYWLFACFALQIFELRLAAQQIRSYTNGFVFLGSIKNLNCFFFLLFFWFGWLVGFWGAATYLLIHQQADSTDQQNKTAAESHGHHYLVDRGAPNHLFKEGLTKHSVFPTICNFPDLSFPQASEIACTTVHEKMEFEDKISYGTAAQSFSNLRLLWSLLIK